MNKNQKVSVKKGEDGLPVAFRVLAPGALHYTLKDASSCVATITENDVKDMADWHAAKGVRLPIDCEHYVHYITRLVGVTEDDFRDRFPTARGILGDCVIAMHDGDTSAIVISPFSVAVKVPGDKMRHANGNPSPSLFTLIF